jgi:hypothetical protein
MKTLSIQEVEGQLGKLIDEAYQGETIVLTNGDKKVTLEPGVMLNREEDSPELEAELLKAVNGPHSPMREGELREIANQAVQEYRVNRKK